MAFLKKFVNEITALYSRVEFTDMVMGFVFAFSVILAGLIAVRKKITPLTLFTSAALIRQISIDRFFAIVAAYAGVGAVSIVPFFLSNCGLRGVIVFTFFFFICAVIKMYEIYIAAYNQKDKLEDILLFGPNKKIKILKVCLYIFMIFTCFDLSVFYQVLNNASFSLIEKSIELAANFQKIIILISICCLLIFYGLSYSVMSKMNMMFGPLFLILLIIAFIKNPSFSLLLVDKPLSLPGVLKCAFCAQFLTDVYSMFSFFDVYHFRMYNQEDKTIEKEKLYKDGIIASSCGLLFAFVLTMCCSAVCANAGDQDLFAAVINNLPFVNRVIIRTFFTLFLCSAFFTYNSCVKSLLYALLKNLKVARFLHILLTILFLFISTKMNKVGALHVTYVVCVFYSVFSMTVLFYEVLRKNSAPAVRG